MSQNPCAETFATSTAKVFLPRSADLILVPPDQPKRGGELARGQPVVLGRFYPWFDPDLGLAASMLDMHMHSRLFP
jgi:hypothetical protein